MTRRIHPSCDLTANSYNKGYTENLERKTAVDPTRPVTSEKQSATFVSSSLFDVCNILSVMCNKIVKDF